MKRIGILLLTCVLLLSLTACSKSTDSGDAVVVEVGGVSVKKSEAEDIYRATLQQTLNMYAQLGFAMDGTDAEFVATMKEDALYSIGQQLALEQELAKRGVGLTDEDIKAIGVLAQTEYDTMIDQFAAYYGLSKTEAIKSATEASYTLNVLRFSLRGNEILNRLTELLAPDVTVSDDEILERYDALLEDQKETYATDLSQYVTDVFSDAIIVSRPEGMRYIKNIVIAISDEILAQIEQLDAELYDVSYNLYLVELELDAGEMEESEKQELQVQHDVYEAEVARLNAEIEVLIKAGQDQVREEAKAVLALCKAEGANFDAIMSEHNDDTPTGDLLTKGYPVGAGVTNYVASFTEASMAMENIGDISDLVESVYGFHILQYAQDVDSGVVPLDDVKTDIYDLLLESKKEESLDAEVARITEAAEIVTYPDRL